MDAAVQAYVDGIGDDSRALFDRIHRLVLAAFPDVEIGIAYKMPAYRRAGRSLHLGAWQHGVSFYGFPEEGAVSILERHPELSSGKGTLRITHAVADDIRDDELVQLVRATLGDDRVSAPI